MNSGLRQKQLEGEKQIISRETEKHSHKPVLNCSKEPELGSRLSSAPEQARSYRSVPRTALRAAHDAQGKEIPHSHQGKPSRKLEAESPREQLLASPARNI